jgi:hypothetical protein
VVDRISGCVSQIRRVYLLEVTGNVNFGSKSCGGEQGSHWRPTQMPDK